MDSRYSEKTLTIVGFGALLFGQVTGYALGHYYGDKAATKEVTAKVEEKCNTYLKNFIAATEAQRHREEVERRFADSRKSFDRIESRLNGFHSKMSEPTLNRKRGYRKGNENSRHKHGERGNQVSQDTSDDKGQSTAIQEKQ